MSLRTKAMEVRARGIAERDNFTPHGTALKIYKYWANDPVTLPPENENWCHYWRVVAIWAPFLYVQNKFLDATGTGTRIAVGAAAYIGLFFLIGWWTTPAVIVISIGGPIVIGILVLIAFGVARYCPESIKRFLDNHEDSILATFLILFAISGITIISIMIITSLGWLGLLIIPGAVIALGVVALLGAIVSSVLSDFISGKRAKVLDARHEYFMKHNEFPPAKIKIRKPSKVKAFFSGVGDFIVFVAQVVRVFKWKKCPLMAPIDKDAE